MLGAIQRVGQADLTAPLYFVCTADEEVSYIGAKHVVASSELYREMVQGQPHTLIGEPTNLKVVHAHKGICGLRVTSHGKAAHSGTAEGKNANLAMIPFLQAMKAIHDETESDPKWQNNEFSPSSVSWNIGINDRTKAMNMTPAQSVCTIFFRPLPGVDEQPLIDRVRQAAKQYGLEFKLVGHCGAVYTAADDPTVLEALLLANRDHAVTVSYGTDAGELTELNHKFVCGPGDIAQAHTSDEWIELSQLAAGTDLYEKFLRHWCLS
jgi:acetylornithine deacetylase